MQLRSIIALVILLTTAFGGYAYAAEAPKWTPPNTTWQEGFGWKEVFSKPTGAAGSGGGFETIPPDGITDNSLAAISSAPVPSPKCPSGQFWDGANCKPVGERCAPGFTFSVDRCMMVVPTCDATEYFDRNIGKCRPLTLKCLAGFKYNTATKICDPKCPTDQYWEATSEVCKPKTDTCTAGTTYNAGTEKCESICGVGEFYSLVKNACEATATVCKSGFVYDKGACVPISKTCQPGYTLNAVSNVCEASCATNEYYDTVQEKCLPRCATGTSYDTVKKACLSICAEAEHYDYAKGGCVAKCPAGYTYDAPHKSCVANCPEESVFESRVDKFVDEVFPGLADDEQKQAACDAINRAVSEHLQPPLEISDIADTASLKTKLMEAIDEQYAGEHDKLKAFLNAVQNNGNELLANNPLKIYKNPEEYWDVGLNACRPLAERCATGMKYNAGSSTCENICAEGEVYNWAGNNCISACKADYVYNPGTKKCEARCDEDKKWDGTACVSKCTVGYTYNTSLKKCIKS